MKTILCIIILSFLLTTISIADIINVPADIDSIQGGIDLAVDGDTVLVQPGTYYENINFNGKNIVVGSLTLITGNTSYISQTVIDADSSGSVVTFENGEDSTTIFYGFTLTNGNGGTVGGGILITNSGPVISNLIIRDSKADLGGGIYVDRSNPKISHVTLFSNRGTIASIVPIGTKGYGGGIYSHLSDLELTNVTICGNIALKTGAGIFCNDSKLTLVNTIIWNNSPDAILDTNSSIINAFYSDIQDTLLSGVGNINVDPMFVDTANGDYNLKQGSPCIDKGIQDTMIVYNNGQDTIFIPELSYNGNAPDMGAYESEYTATKIENTLKVPTKFSLSQNYPNPFNPSTTIEFSLPKSEYVELKVYNILGKEVSTLVSNKLNQGNHTYTFDGKNLASGIYYYQLVAENYREVKKMILLK
jgi:hypothetical protein